jgi:hypothetical protein
MRTSVRMMMIARIIPLNVLWDLFRHTEAGSGSALIVAPWLR